MTAGDPAMLSTAIAHATSSTDLHPTFAEALREIATAYRRRTYVEWRTVEVTSSLTVDMKPFLGGESYDCMAPTVFGEFFEFVQTRYPIACYHHESEGMVTLVFLGYPEGV